MAKKIEIYLLNTKRLTGFVSLDVSIIFRNMAGIWVTLKMPDHFLKSFPNTHLVVFCVRCSVYWERKVTNKQIVLKQFCLSFSTWLYTDTNSYTLDEKSTNGSPMLKGRWNFLYLLNVITDSNAIHQLDEKGFKDI